MIDRLDGVFGLVDARANRRIAAQVAGNQVLDLGCGFGGLVDELRRQGREAVGIDLLDHQIEAGRRRFPEADLRLVEDGPLDFPDASFDTVILKDSLHHLAAEGDVEAAMREVARVCRRRVLVWEPNPSVPLRLGRTIIGHVDPMCPPEQARGILQAAGFAVRGVQYGDALAFPLSGGYVSRPLMPRAAVPVLFKVDDVLIRVLGRHAAWRYLMIAEKA
jgi:SAM-dependent methyltransferase